MEEESNVQKAVINDKTSIPDEISSITRITTPSINSITSLMKDSKHLLNVTFDYNLKRLDQNKQRRNKKKQLSRLKKRKIASWKTATLQKELLRHRLEEQEKKDHKDRDKKRLHKKQKYFRDKLYDYYVHKEQRKLSENLGLINEVNLMLSKKPDYSELKRFRQRDAEYVNKRKKIVKDEPIRRSKKVSKKNIDMIRITRDTENHKAYKRERKKRLRSKDSLYILNLKRK